MARHLITSAIPYINGIKHLGNLVGSQLPADLYARYLRSRGHEVLFLCATDEHGTPAELAAAKAGKPEAEVAKQAANWLISELFGALNKLGKGLDTSPISPAAGAELLALVADGTISGSIAKQVLEKMLELLLLLLLHL